MRDQKESTAARVRARVIARPHGALMDDRHDLDGELLSLSSLGECLLEVLELAQRDGAQNFLRDAVGAFRKPVPFDSAWWGELSPGSADRIARNWTHGSIALAPTFAQEWNRIAPVDVFAQSSISQLETVVHFDGSVGTPRTHPAVDEFGRRHGLFHGMAITLELPHSGLHFFVSLYRVEGRSTFTLREQVMLKWFVKHLVKHWLGLVAVMRDHDQSWDAYALVDSKGVVHYLGGRVGRVLDAADPGWSGTTLSNNLVSGLGQRRTLWSSKTIRLVQHSCGELFVLSLASSGYERTLPPRELSVAALYIQGHSSKKIASLVGLSPATVRTYLSNAYRHLGVQNKFELMEALQRRPGR